MELLDFVDKFASQFDETDRSEFTPSTKYHDLDEWSSLMGLSIIAMIDDEYGLIVKGDDIRKSVTIEDLYNIVKSNQ